MLSQFLDPHELGKRRKIGYRISPKAKHACEDYITLIPSYRPLLYGFHVPLKLWSVFSFAYNHFKLRLFYGT